MISTKFMWMLTLPFQLYNNNIIISCVPYLTVPHWMIMHDRNTVA